MNIVTLANKLNTNLHRVLFYHHWKMHRNTKGICFIDPENTYLNGFENEFSKYMNLLAENGILNRRLSYSYCTKNIFQQEAENSSKIVSNFTDSCAKRICGLSANRIIRSVADMFIPGEESRHADYVHAFAMEALKKYGGQLLTFYYFVDLRSNTIKTKRRENLQLQGSTIYSQIYTLPNIIYNSRIGKSPYQFMFRMLNEYERHMYLSTRSYAPEYVIMNNSGIVLYELLSDSIFLSNTFETTPIVDLFTTNQELEFGYDSDRCELCGKAIVSYNRGCLHKNLATWK